MRARGTRAVVAAGFAAGAMVLAAASFAWACEAGIFSGTPAITADPASVTVGTTQVRVSGQGWTNGQQVALRWNSKSGSQVGSALPGGANGEFNTSATVPAVAAGDDYQIFAVQEGTGKVYGLPFRVTPQASTATPEQPGTGGGTTTNRVAVADPSEPVSATAVTQTAPSSAGSAGTGGREAPGVVANDPVRVSEPIPATDDRAPAAAVNRPSLLQEAAPAALSAADREASAAAETTTAVEETAPSVRTASGDLWSGFSPAAGRSGPGLTSLPSTSSGSSDLAVGLGLLSAGLVALFAGFGVAELNRRRVVLTRKAG